MICVLKLLSLLSPEGPS